MNKRKLFLYSLFWIGLSLILGYEFIALYQNQGQTISEITWRVITIHPIVSFALGYLCGHLTWQSADVYREDISKLR